MSYDLFDFMVSQRLALARHREWRAPLNSDSGFHADVLLMHEVANPRTTADYDRYIARLNDLPRYFDENVANMREGMRDSFTLPAEILEGIARIVAAEQFKDPEDCPLFRPFADFPTTVPEADHARLAAAGRAAIERSVIPAYARFQDFFEREYRPRARRTVGGSELPGGRAYYADLVRYFTTLPGAIALATAEMFVSACFSFTTYPGLTRGCANLIESFGTPEQKALFLEKMYAGQWTGTMCLTEPQAGSAVGV